MNELLETLYAKEFKSNEKDPNCKTCKNKPKFKDSWVIWFGVWMVGMSVYGNVVFFKKIIEMII